MAMEPHRRAMLAKVHIARKELALPEDSYRAILVRIAGQESAVDCSDEQLDAVLGEFRRLGWTPKTKHPRSAVPHVRLIYALWGELEPFLEHRGAAALRSFVRRQTGVERPEWLDSTQGNKVVEGLKAWLGRERGKPGKRAS